MFSLRHPRSFDLRPSTGRLAAATLASLVLGGCGDDAPSDAATAALRAAQRADLAALAPENCAVYAVLSSVDAVQKWADDTAGAEGAGDVFDGLAMFGAAFGNLSLIDRTLPVGFALAIDQGRAAPVLLVPASDPDGFAASLTQLDPVVIGTYVALPLGGIYRPAAAVPEVCRAMPDATIAVRAEAITLTDAWKRQIDALLREGEAGFARALEQDPQLDIDGRVLAKVYFGYIRTLVDSARRVELTASGPADALQVLAKVHARLGSAMDGWDSIERPDWRGLTHGLDADLPVAAIWSMPPKVLEGLIELSDAFIAAYPEDLMEALGPLTDDYLRVYRLMSPELVMSGLSFGESGMEVSMRSRVTDTEALHAAVADLVANASLGEIGMVFDPPQPVEAGGATAVEYRMNVDIDRLAKVVGRAPADRDADRIEMRAALVAVFGEGGTATARLATRGGFGVFSLSADPAYHERALASLGQGDGQLPAVTDRAFEALEGCNPVIVQRIDIGQILGSISSIAERDPALQSKSGPHVPGDASAVVTYLFGIKSREWRAGMEVDLAGFARMISDSIR